MAPGHRGPVNPQDPNLRMGRRDMHARYESSGLSHGMDMLSYLCATFNTVLYVTNLISVLEIQVSCGGSMLILLMTLTVLLV